MDYARIDVDDLHAILVAYEKRGERAAREMGSAIALALHAEVMELFETEGYGEWPGFADSTLDQRLKKTPNPKLLQDTGVLVNSIQIETDELSVTAYTNVPYSTYHISPLPRAVIPLRDFLAIDTEMFELLVAEMFEIHMTRPLTDTELPPPSRGGGRAA
jgi:phage gpG-like protein